MTHGSRDNSHKSEDDRSECLDFARILLNGAFTRLSLSGERNTTKEGQSLKTAHTAVATPLISPLHLIGASLTVASPLIRDRVQGGGAQRRDNSCRKHEITLRNAVVGLQLFRFKVPSLVCVCTRRRAHTRVRRAARAPSVYDWFPKEQRQPLFRGM